MYVYHLSSYTVIASIFCIIFTSYEVVMVVRHDDLSQHRRLYKLGRLYLDFLMLKLWLGSLLVAFLVGGTAVISLDSTLTTFSYVACVLWVGEM